MIHVLENETGAATVVDDNDAIRRTVQMATDDPRPFVGCGRRRVAM